MSLAGLVSGAECAVQVNPLSQVLKHTDGDRSLQQVRLLASPMPCATYHAPLGHHCWSVIGKSERTRFLVDFFHLAQLLLAPLSTLDFHQRRCRA